MTENLDLQPKLGGLGNSDKKSDLKRKLGETVTENLDLQPKLGGLGNSDKKSDLKRKLGGQGAVVGQVPGLASAGFLCKWRATARSNNQYSLEPRYTNCMPKILVCQYRYEPSSAYHLSIVNTHVQNQISSN